MALGSTQPLTERVPEVLSGGKGGRSLGLTSLSPSYADCLEILGALTSWDPRVLYRPLQAAFSLKLQEYGRW